jgi:hypothetical protein
MDSWEDFSFWGDSIYKTGSMLESNLDANPLFCDVNLSDFLTTRAVCEIFSVDGFSNFSVFVFSFTKSLVGVR